MSVYRRSVSNCVSFPCVVYFCLFSPLKDRYAFCIQYMPPASGGSAPRPPPSLCPWTPLGASVPQTPCFVLVNVEMGGLSRWQGPACYAVGGGSLTHPSVTPHVGRYCSITGRTLSAGFFPRDAVPLHPVGRRHTPWRA